MLTTIYIGSSKKSYNILKEKIGKSCYKVKILIHLKDAESAIDWLFKNKHPDIIFIDLRKNEIDILKIFDHFTIITPFVCIGAKLNIINRIKDQGLFYLIQSSVYVKDIEKAIRKYDSMRQFFKKETKYALEFVQDIIE